MCRTKANAKLVKWLKKNKKRVVSIGPCWKLTSICCSASFGEPDASLLSQRKALHSLSHPSLCLKIPLVWLALMLAAHWQTDWLAWEKEEGKRGRGWMGKKIPILRLAGRAHWRSAVLPGFYGGRYRVPFSTSSLLPLSEFQGAPDSDLWTPWRSILPPFKCRRRTPHLSKQLTNVRPSLLNATAVEQERPQCILSASHVTLEENRVETIQLKF